MADGNGNGAAPDAVAAFPDRVRTLLAESQEHVEKLSARRIALKNEQEAEVARIREDYRAKLDEIDAQLATVRRIERALDPEAHVKPGPKSAGESKNNGNGGKSPAPAFVPSVENQDAVLLALYERDKATVKEIAEVVGVSGTTVKFALDVMRDARPQLVRLAGQGTRGARLWAVTSAGGERARTEINTEAKA